MSNYLFIYRARKLRNSLTPNSVHVGKFISLKLLHDAISGKDYISWKIYLTKEFLRLQLAKCFAYLHLLL